MTGAKSNLPTEVKQTSQLYQSMILEHNRSPFGYGLISNATHKAEGYNPICGDRVEITLDVQAEVVVQIGFESQSCALCRASASVLAKHLSGMKLNDATQYSEDFEKMILKGDRIVSGDAAAFVAIKDFPARAKCVVLPWRTFSSALKNDSPTMKQVLVKTEA